MSRPLARPLLAALLLTGSGAAAQDAPPQGKALAGGFMLADVDGDGRVTLDELLTLLNARYSALDSDSDDRVAVADLYRADDVNARPRFAPSGEGMPRPPGGLRGPPPGGFRGPPPGGAGGRPPGPPPGSGDLADGFPYPRPEDGNEDGVISRAEFVAPAAAMLDAWDGDHGGTVTAAEAQSSPTEGDRR